MSNKKIIVVDVFMVLTLIIVNLLPGSPLRYNIDVPNLVINIIALAYLIYLIYKKEYMQINKVDVILIILSFSCFIPIIFNTYLRLGDTVEYILRYMSALNIYFIVKKYIKLNSKGNSIILNTCIGMSIVLIFIGIDMMTLNLLDKVYNFLRSPLLYKDSLERMNSLFRYSNTFCIYIVMALFLSIAKYLKEEKRYKKTIYSCCIFLEIFAIMISYSRLSWGIAIVLLIGLAIILKEYRKEILKLLLISGINAFVYFCLFNEFSNVSANWCVWIILIIQVALQYVVFFKLNAIDEFIKKLNKKKIVVSICGILITILMILAAIYFSGPDNLIIFNTSNYQNIYRKQNIKVEKNAKYNLKIDLEAVSEKEENFTIYAKQLDSNEKEIRNEVAIFDNYEGIKELNFETTDNVSSLTIGFKCQEPSQNTKLVIKSVKLNDKDIKVYYKLIPIDLVNRIEKFKIKTASTNTRIWNHFIQNSIIQSEANIVYRNIYKP